MTESTKKNRNYIDNKKLTQDIKEYNIIYYNAVNQGLPKPKMPDCIGEAIIKIAEAIGSKWNFKNYTYRDEMVLDGICQAVYSITKFNAEKFDNAFGYLTMIIWRSMGQRIKNEKEQQEIIEKLLEDPNYLFYEEDENGNDSNTISKENLVDFYYEGKLHD